MEIFNIDKDICVACITAESFPEKVGAAHKKLHEILKQNKSRKFFGLSRPDKTHTIIYKAAAEVIEENEIKESGLETFTIKKGKYISIFISNFCDDPKSIGNAFRELLKYPEVDYENGYCLEIYDNDVDVRCLVPLTKK